MKRDLLRLIIALSISGMIVGCGSSGSSASTANVGQCTYSIVNPTPILAIGDNFNASAISATAKKSDGTEAATPTATGLDNVNTSSTGSYSIVFASTDCDNTDATTVEVIDVRQCTYSIVNPTPILTVGDDFNASAISATAKKGDKTEAATPTATGLDDVNTSSKGSYSIVFASTDCDNTAATTVKVNEADTSDDNSDILPF
jgi:hypothetical protein